MVAASGKLGSRPVVPFRRGFAKPRSGVSRVSGGGGGTFAPRRPGKRNAGGAPLPCRACPSTPFLRPDNGTSENRLPRVFAATIRAGPKTASKRAAATPSAWSGCGRRPRSGRVQASLRDDRRNRDFRKFVPVPGPAAVPPPRDALSAVVGTAAFRSARRFPGGNPTMKCNWESGKSNRGLRLTGRARRLERGAKA